MSTVEEVLHEDDSGVHLTQASKRTYICGFCQEIFSSLSELTEHTTTAHTDEKPFSCEICQEFFFTKFAFDRHISIHLNESTFIPEECENGPFNKDSVKKQSLSNSDEKLFICNVDTCRKRFSSIRRLKGHLISHRKPHICEVCQRGFSQKFGLTRHFRTHTGERPFVCEICQKGFCIQFDLKVHSLSHFGDKPFVCEVCKKGFTCKSVLIIHLRTHTGEKPFVCETCQRAFNRKEMLKKHYRTHMDKKCFVCDEKFSTKRLLKKHLCVHT